CSAYSLGTGVQATGCTTCTLPPATAPCSTCQTAPPAPPITMPPSQWGEWGAFGPCTVSCGGGTRTRQRLCNGGCSTCQCLGSSVDIQSCNTAACPTICTTCRQTQPHYDPPVTQAPCTTCQQIPHYDPPVTQAPCTTCQQVPHYDPPVTPAPCLTCSQYQQPAPAPTYTQPAPSSCTTCGTNFRYYDPYNNAGRKKRSQQDTKGSLSFLIN
ncbi:thrombospondin type 1 domain protein, partial [Teladorsagia circumcincta]